MTTLDIRVTREAYMSEPDTDSQGEEVQAQGEAAEILVTGHRCLQVRGSK